MSVLNGVLRKLFGTNQTYKFIGSNHSMGLINGDLYELKVRSWKNDGVQITWHDQIRGRMWCPYSSKDVFLQNWELCHI